MNKPLKLIVENEFNDFDIMITESTTSKGHTKIKIKGPFIVAEKRNENGRLYPRQLMEKSVDVFEKSMIQTSRAFGELEHPPTIEIDLNKACHLITDLKQEGDIWVGESVVLTSSPDGAIKGTPKGDILASLIQFGGKPGVSTRGAGYVNESDGMVEEYELVTEDVVSNPSGPGCFVNGILESKNFMLNVHGELMECAYDSFEKGIQQVSPHAGVHVRQNAQTLEQVFRQFIEQI